MGISKTSDHIQIKIKMPNPSQEPPASSKTPNEDWKDMDVLCTFNIKTESAKFASICLEFLIFPTEESYMLNIYIFRSNIICQTSLPYKATITYMRDAPGYWIWKFEQRPSFKPFDHVFPGISFYALLFLTTVLLFLFVCRDFWMHSYILYYGLCF